MATPLKRSTAAAERSESDPIPLEDLVTPERLAQERPDLFTPAGLKWLIRNRGRNGLSATGAVLLVRNRVVLRRSGLERWLADQTT